jgi:hypothetical protein
VEGPCEHIDGSSASIKEDKLLNWLSKVSFQGFRSTQLVSRKCLVDFKSKDVYQRQYALKHI